MHPLGGGNGKGEIVRVVILALIAVDKFGDGATHRELIAKPRPGAFLTNKKLFVECWAALIGSEFNVEAVFRGLA